MKNQSLGAMKLITGEEIIGFVLDIDGTVESGFHILIKDPLKIEMNLSSNKIKTIYTFTPWFILSNEREHIIDSSRILAMNSVDDDDVRREYIRYFNMIERSERNTDEFKHNPDLGYIGSVKETQKKLERLYKLESHLKAPDEPQ